MMELIISDKLTFVHNHNAVVVTEGSILIFFEEPLNI